MPQLRRILHLAEASVAQGPVLARAVSLAERTQGELTVLDVVPVIPASIGQQGSLHVIDAQAALVNGRRTELSALIAPYRSRRDILVDVQVGEVFLEVIRAVLRDGHDLLIKRAENPSFIERLFGTDDMHLLRKCPCPVWLTRPDERSSYACILAAVDFDVDGRSNSAEQALNERILELASLFALADVAVLHLIHAWDAPAEGMVRSWADNPVVAGGAYVEGERSRHERAFNLLRDQLRDHLGSAVYERLAPRFHLRRGAAVEVVPGLAKQLHADLVVMGTVARTGIAGLFIGNTAERILEQLQCSVLAIKPPGFVSPVKPTE